jgi:membrane protease YdiL (CAAX protease family)
MRHEPPRPAEPAPTGPAAWPWWFAPVGFVGAFLVAALASGVLALIFEAFDLNKKALGFTLAGAFLLEAALVGVAVFLAGQRGRPRARDFGLRPAPFRRTVGVSVLGIVGYLVFVGFYGAIVDPGGEQSVAKELGLDRSTASLFAGGVAVVVLAPIGEEFFFRGFFYAALRSGFRRALGGRAAGRWPAVAGAAVLSGGFFGLVHIEPKALDLIPVLAVLGIVFCLVYELTGTLYATISLHAMVNAAALSQIADDGPLVALPLLLLVVGGCVAAARLAPRKV